MEQESQITICLSSGFLLGIVPAGIVLDGKRVAIWSDGQPLTIPVSAGSHSLRLNDGVWGSNTERFTLQPGEHIEFECSSALWRDWKKKKRIFWWASPFVETLIFRPCLTRVGPKS